MTTQQTKFVRINDIIFNLEFVTIIEIYGSKYMNILFNTGTEKELIFNSEDERDEAFNKIIKLI